ELPLAWEWRDVELVGVVAGLPQPSERGVRFMLDVDRATTVGAVAPRRVSLMWYAESATAPPRLAAGERWRLTARLKRPRGLANPHGFDFEPWALERGIRAIGYVRSRAGAERTDERVPGVGY